MRPGCSKFLRFRLRQHQADQGLSNLGLEGPFDREDLKRALLGDQEQRLHLAILGLQFLEAEFLARPGFLTTASSVASETTGYSSDPSNPPGWIQPNIGPATIPNTSSNRIEGMRTRQPSHWAEMPRMTTALRLTRACQPCITPTSLDMGCLASVQDQTPGRGVKLSSTRR